MWWEVSPWLLRLVFKERYKSTKVRDEREGGSHAARRVEGNERDMLNYCRFCVLSLVS